MITTPLSRSALLALAPVQLRTYRATRYQGDDQSIPFASFALVDQHILTRMYGVLQMILNTTMRYRDTPGEGAAPLHALIKELNWSQVVHDVRELGKATYAMTTTPLMREVLHDIKGGSFMALSVGLQLIEIGITQPDDVTRTFFLARDHRKIIRNAVPDLDAHAAALDQTSKAHSTQLLIEKWAHAAYNLPNHTVRVEIDTGFVGDISDRCVEFSALDRVLYNLVNNAARNTVDGVVHLAMLPVEADQPHNLRFVVYNAIGAEQRAQLTAHFGDKLNRLFLGGFTTDGTGLGMRICANFVANAYGVHTIERALAEQYIGSCLVDEQFVAWFHWPLIAD